MGCDFGYSPRERTSSIDHRRRHVFRNRCVILAQLSSCDKQLLFPQYLGDSLKTGFGPDVWTTKILQTFREIKKVMISARPKIPQSASRPFNNDSDWMSGLLWGPRAHLLPVLSSSALIYWASGLCAIPHTQKRCDVWSRRRHRWYWSNKSKTKRSQVRFEHQTTDVTLFFFTYAFYALIFLLNKLAALKPQSVKVDWSE